MKFIKTFLNTCEGNCRVLGVGRKDAVIVPGALRIHMYGKTEGGDVAHFNLSLPPPTLARLFTLIEEIESLAVGIEQSDIIQEVE